MSQRQVETIEMLERRHGLFPKLFRRGDDDYLVTAVERTWTVGTEAWFRVRCAQGTFDVFQDVRYNTWQLRALA